MVVLSDSTSFPSIEDGWEVAIGRLYLIKPRAEVKCLKSNAPKTKAKSREAKNIKEEAQVIMQPPAIGNFQGYGRN
jgi:hypothetical protein